MDRPRLVAIISATVASTAAFAVVSRWGLVGTVAGAACVPLVYNLVSHSLAWGIDRSIGWARRVAGGDDRDVDDEDSDRRSLTCPSVRCGTLGWDSTARSSARDGTDGKPDRSLRARTQWVLGGLALMSLALSVYSVTVPGETGKTVETVIVTQRLVTVETVWADPMSVGNAGASEETLFSSSAQGATTDGSASADATASVTSTEYTTATEGPTTPVSTTVSDPGGAVTSTTTTEPGQPGQEDGISPTTTTTVQGEDGAPPTLPVDPPDATTP